MHAFPRIPTWNDLIDGHYLEKNMWEIGKFFFFWYFSKINSFSAYEICNAKCYKIIVVSDISSCDSINENLLQKVVQLQMELLKRDSEVAFLKKAITLNGMPNKYNASIDSPYNLRGSFRNVSNYW